MEECGISLKEWAATEFREIKSLIKITERKLAKAQRQSPDAHTLASCSKMSDELHGLHRVEEAYWHMRSRVNELKDGDKNTKYFHHKGNSRRKRNTIRGLNDENGHWKTSKSDIERLVVAYVKSIFASTSPSGFPEALEGINTVVTGEMN